MTTVERISPKALMYIINTDISNRLGRLCFKTGSERVHLMHFASLLKSPARMRAERTNKLSSVSVKQNTVRLGKSLFF
jgi:hypothetical protein